VARPREPYAVVGAAEAHVLRDGLRLVTGGHGLRLLRWRASGWTNVGHM
jgi:hypothetical protein